MLYIIILFLLSLPVDRKQVDGCAAREREREEAINRIEGQTDVSQAALFGRRFPFFRSITQSLYLSASSLCLCHSLLSHALPKRAFCPLRAL